MSERAPRTKMVGRTVVLTAGLVLASVGASLWTLVLTRQDRPLLTSSWERWIQAREWSWLIAVAGAALLVVVCVTMLRRLLRRSHTPRPVTLIGDRGSIVIHPAAIEHDVEGRLAQLSHVRRAKVHVHDERRSQRVLLIEADVDDARALREVSSSVLTTVPSHLESAAGLGGAALDVRLRLVEPRPPVRVR
jgi:hypothetical protein